MIQNLLILKKNGIPGFVYANMDLNTETPEEPTVTIEEVNE